MKNKLMFRILGAISSALIIVAVFVPFVSVTGYSQSLWQAYELIDTLYLPIMIIVFGAIGVVFFSLNIKTELAYTSCGALLFFLLTQTIPIIQQGTFGTLGIGYYFLAIGSVLTGVMAFLCNIGTNQKNDIKKEIEPSRDISVIDQINKLYDNQTTTLNTQENNLNSVVQPLPVQNNVSINPTSISTQVQQSVPLVSNDIVQQPIVEQASIPEVSPVAQDINTNQNNPVVSEFSEPIINQGISNDVPMPTIPEINFSNDSVNPVISEFSQNNPQQNIGLEQPIFPTAQPLNNINQTNVTSEPNNNSSNLDIFG